MLKTGYQYLSKWDPSDIDAVIPPIQVVTCVFQCEDKFLVLQRARKDLQHNLWGIPGGKLDQGEEPISGLIRESYEELGVSFSKEIFQLLGTAISRTPSDGQYGLYVYHAVVARDLHIEINLAEHYAFRWVTVQEFLLLDLLTAQREAFMLVQEKVMGLFNLTQKI